MKVHFLRMRGSHANQSAGERLRLVNLPRAREDSEECSGKLTEIFVRADVGDTGENVLILG